MKIFFLVTFIFSVPFFACGKEENERYIFFLHNRFLETHALDEIHPEYGRTQLAEITAEFKSNGFVVFSDKRVGTTNERDYANQIIKQIDSLLVLGVPPNHITVVGTSKGGYIA